MNQKLLVGTAVLTLSLGASLSVQAQTAPITGTTNTTPRTTNSISAPSTFTPGTNPSGSINYNNNTSTFSGTTTGSSGFTPPSNTLSQPNSNFNNSNFNNLNQTRTNNTINAFPPYNPYSVDRPQSIYISPNNPPSRFGRGSGGFGSNNSSGGFGGNSSSGFGVNR